MPSDLQLSYVDGAGELQVLEFDALLTELHQHTARATQFPVETGSAISDHVLQEPDVVRVEVLFSDSPLPSTVGMQPDEFREAAEGGDFRGRAAELYRQVVGIKEAAVPVTLTSTVHTYENLVVEAVELPVDASRGDAVQVGIQLRHVRKVGLRTVPVPKIERAAPKVSKGKQQTRPAETIPDSAARAAKKALVGP